MFDNRIPKILIISASRHGHTRKIARHIADAAAAQGLEPCLLDVDAATDVDVREFDAVVVGGSIHMQRHDERLVAWVDRHRAVLGLRPTGFFSVSMASATDSDEGRATAREYIDRFVEDTDWTPRRCLAVAGALQYREYGFLTRQMVRQIAAQKGLSTDTSRDTEYTDWDELDRFAGALVADVRHQFAVASRVQSSGQASPPPVLQRSARALA